MPAGAAGSQSPLNNDGTLPIAGHNSLETRSWLMHVQGGHYEAVCNGCSECQGTCNLTEKDAPVCKSAIEHTTSKGGGRTLATLVMDSGYWRTTNSSRDVLECYHKDACMEAETGTAGNCNTGYEGACECPLLCFQWLVFVMKSKSARVYRKFHKLSLHTLHAR